MTARPPRGAEWLVEKTLPPDPTERDAVIGDLAEEHAAIAEGDSPRAADRWYWRQTVRSLGPNLLRRWTWSAGGRERTGHGGFMDTLLQDIRYGARMLARRPMVTTIATASLIVGIALPAVVFTLLDAVMFRPLAIADPDRVAIVLEQRQGSINHNFSYPDFADYRSAQRVFTDLAAYARWTATLREGERSRVVDAELVSGNYFSTLGIRLTGGRGLTNADDRPDAHPAAVVAAALWRDIAGDAPFSPRTIVLNTREFAVVGVVAPAFRGMEVGRDVRVWAPIHAQPLLDSPDSGDLAARRTASWLILVGRLAHGATRGQAALDLGAADASMSDRLGRPRRTFAIVAGRQGDSMLPQVTGGPLTLLFGAAVLVLLVACANVANLLLARASEREREIAVRAALGAGRARLARLVLIETLLLSTAGACAAACAARWIASGAAAFIARFDEPATLDVSFDWRTIGFVAALAAIATILTGAGPVLGVVGRNKARPLADGGRAVSAGPLRTRTRRALVAAQFALSLALVVAALLLAATVRNLRLVPTGLDLDHVALISIDPSAARMDPSRTRAYIERAVARLAAAPGVRAAGFGRVIPLGLVGSRTSITVPGYQPAPDEDMEINYNVVTGSYFDATGIGIVEGRPFSGADTAAGEPVAIVNETMARRYWSGAAVGRQISTGDDSPPIRVVGVARDVKYRELREDLRPSFYLPLSQDRAASGVLHVRVAGDPRRDLDSLRRMAGEIDPSVPVTAVRTLRAQADLNLNDERLAMLIGVTLGAAALLLAAVGLYGSLAYTVGQRTRELGVRMALGATAGDVCRMVLQQGVALSIAGTVLGAGLAAVMARALESRLFGVHVSDVPVLFAAAATVLAAVALAASWMPARRAARVDPVDALRAE